MGPVGQPVSATTRSEPRTIGDCAARSGVGRNSSSRADLFEPPTSAVDETARIEIGILGPITVTGWPEPTQPRPTVLEILAFLALHPERSWPADALTDHLNRGRPRDLKVDTVRTYLNTARQAVGAERLPDATRTGYTLTGIGTDWDRYQHDRWTDLPKALTLVRGPLFDGVDRATFGWLATSPILANIEIVITGDAEQAATAALADGDRELATWSVAQGLLVEATNETLLALSLDTAADLPRAWRDINRRYTAIDEPVPDLLARRYDQLRAHR